VRNIPQNHGFLKIGAFQEYIGVSDSSVDNAHNEALVAVEHSRSDEYFIRCIVELAIVDLDLDNILTIFEVLFEDFDQLE
jgi:hypothetical protein